MKRTQHTPNSPKEPLMTVKAAAEQVGLGLTRMYEIINEGQLTVVRLGPRSTRIRPVDLQQWIADHMSPAKAG